jgi:RND family efflux transporter MFP subunit
MTFRNTLIRFGRKALIVPPILAGIAVLIFVKSRNTGPAQEPPAEASRPLRVITVPHVTVVPRALGYGTAKPGDIWTAVAEVKGRVTFVHPELKAGAIIRGGTEVLRIDPTDYDLRVAGLKAEIAQIEAQQDELQAQESNIKNALQIEQRSLELAQQDLKRVEDLRTANATAEATLDEALRNVLRQQQTIQSLESQRNVLPAQRDALAAGLLAKEANLDQAKVDRDRTVLSAPFDCRLSDVALEVGQFLTAGQVLFEAYGAAVTEVEVQMPIDQVRRLLTPRDEVIDLGGDAMQTVRDIFDVQAIVRMRSGGFVVQWEGRFDRIREELDLQTRTLRIVIAVDNPYEGVVPGKRPPLSPGMFCEVELRGAARPDQIVLPRASVRDGMVFLVDGQKRLVQRAVTIAFSQGSLSVVSEGLKAGETLIVSDPTPAVEGMLVEPTWDEAIADELVRLAAGEGEVR